MRIGERARLPIAAGMLGVAVTALSARGPAVVLRDPALDDQVFAPQAPDEVTRWSMAARVLEAAAGRDDPLGDQVARWLLGLGEYPAASAPRNPPLGVVSRAARPVRMCASSGVREAVALWSLPALLGGQDPAPWARFGQVVAEPITLLGDLVRLWLDPDRRDLRDAALTPLVEAWLAEPLLGACLLRAYAGERDSPVRGAEIRSLLASRPFRAHLEGMTRRALASARAGLPSTGPADLQAAAADFVEVLDRGFGVFDALTGFRALVDRGSVPAHVPRDGLRDAEADARMAVAYLSEHAPWQDSWEVQRFGLFGSSVPRVGQWFVRGMMLRTLAGMGLDVNDDATRLLSEIPPGELRYYGPWDGIPPDADLLGLMLELIAMTGAARDRAETWIPLLPANTSEEGVAPTWFSRDPKGRPTTPSGSGDSLACNDCDGVRLNLLCGLLAFDAARFDEVIHANTRYVLTRSNGGVMRGVCYYDASYAAFAFLRFARLYREKAVGCALSGAIAETTAAIRARIAACQRLDGGWGSPQRTAFCLESLASMEDTLAGDPDALLFERGMRYLGEHQLIDASWPAEPLYLIPMKHNREGWHRGRALTTAFCASALYVGLAALKRHDSAQDEG
jgi:hypothetical protein